MTLRYLRRLIRDYQTPIFFIVLVVFMILLIWLFRPEVFFATIGAILVLSIAVIWAGSIVGFYRIKTNLMISVGMNTVLRVQDYTNFHECNELCQEEEGYVRNHEASKQYFLNAEEATEKTGDDIDHIIRQLETNTPDDHPVTYHRVSIMEALPIWISDRLISRLGRNALLIVFAIISMIFGIPILEDYVKDYFKWDD